MIFVFFAVAAIATPLFVLMSGENRKRKRQNPTPYEAPAPPKNRASDLD